MIEFHTDAPVLQGDRLTLRPWRAADLPVFAQICADPEVMRYFPRAMTREQCDGFVADVQDRFRRWGFGYWAVETRDGGFCGFIGLSRPSFMAGVEIGWRLHRNAWGHGYATEGARLALAYGFGQCNLKEIISLAPRVNTPSLRVMERLGMRHDVAADFDHPLLPDDSELKPCVLYRLSADDFASTTP